LSKSYYYFGKQTISVCVMSDKGQIMKILNDLQNGLQKLSETDHIVIDEEISAIERNKSEKNKNRKGADIPGLFIVSKISDLST